MLINIVMNVRELVRAGAGGIVATVVDVSALALLVNLGVYIPVAAFCGATLGAVANFIFNKYVAFKDRSKVTGRQLARFGGVALATALLLALLMELVAVRLHVPYLLAKLICAAVVFAAWTYPVQRKFVFRHKETAYV